MGDNASLDTELVEYSYRRVGTRRMYPEVKEYLASLETAERAGHRAELVARHAYDLGMHDLQDRAETEAPGRGAANVFPEEYRALGQAYSDAQGAARTLRKGGIQALLDSPHREVKWIAEHCLTDDEGSDVHGHARTILAHLPATLEELHRVAKGTYNMCEVFDRFLVQAEDDGVFNGGVKPVGARQMAAFNNYVRRNWGSDYVVSFREHLAPVFKAYREDTERQLAEAKAEWQRLDEAQAENATYNRSRAARDAWARRREADLSSDDLALAAPAAEAMAAFE